MKTTGLILATLASLASAQDDGECNIRECGCPPYREKWCDKNNARVFSPICQISKGFCDYTCGEVWCGKSPTPPTPPAPKIHMYHLGNASDIHCYQTNYTDPILQKFRICRWVLSVSTSRLRRHFGSVQWSCKREHQVLS